jgi:hypothetical protein
MRTNFRKTRRQKTRKSKNRKSKKIYGGSNVNETSAPDGQIYAKEVGKDNPPALINIDTIVMLNNNTFKNENNMTCSVTNDGTHSIQVERGNNVNGNLVLALDNIKSITSKEGTYLSDNDANKSLFGLFAGKRYKFTCTKKV